MKDKPRLINTAKSLAIALLSISAVLLLYKATFGGQGSFFGGLDGLFDKNSSSGAVALPQSDVTSLTSSPVFLLVTAKDGSHYAVKYSSDTKEKLIAQFSGSLGEALGSSGKPEEVSVQTWRAALSGSGVFFDYLYPQPLSAIASSLGTEISADTSLESARRFYLGMDGENLVLYFISEGNGTIYCCNTVLSFSTLESKISECPLGTANFAFELGKEYGSLDPYYIFSHETEPLPAVTASNPVRDSYDGTALLERFGMNSQVVSEYTESDGSKVYVEGDKSLRIEASGKVIFDTSGDDGIIVVGGAEGLTIADSISACSAIVKDSIGLVSGDGTTELVNVSNIYSPSSCTVSFGYFVRGLPVTLPGNVYAASFQIRGGNIIKAELYLRNYTLSGGTIVPLPEKQAAVIAETRGGEPVLTYEDKTDSVTCMWIYG